MSEPGKVISLSRFRADVGRALLRRGRAMLEAKDLKTQVGALEPLEAYFIVKELGVDEAVPILRHVTAEQLQAFIDLDCWQDDRPEATELDAWLAPFAGESKEALVAAFLQLDHEVQVLFLGQSLQIWDVRSEEAPEPTSDAPRLNTPDGFFVVEGVGEERELDPLFLVDALYRHDMEEAFKLLMGAKWEPSSEMEELANQFRIARLQGLGFPAPGEAAKLFAAPPHRPNTVQQFPDAGDGTSLPALYAAPLAEGSLLSRALSGLSDAHLVERLERDLVYLVNCAVIAYGYTPRDVAHLGEIAARVRDTVSLGLEVLISPDAPADLEAAVTVQRAAELLGAWPLLDLFRHGYRMVVALQQEARALAADPVAASWLSRAETEHEDYAEERRDRAFLKALLGRPPLLAGWDALKPERSRAFGTQEELAEARQRLGAVRTRLG